MKILKDNHLEQKFKISTQAQDQYLNYMIDSRFQGISRPLLLSYENGIVRRGHITLPSDY